LSFARAHTFEKEFSARIEHIRKLTKHTQSATQRRDIAPTELLKERVKLLLRRKKAERLRSRALRRNFSKTSEHRLLLVTQPERIPQSQIFPFHFFAKGLGSAYDASIKEVSSDEIISQDIAPPENATVIAFQTHYDISDTDLELLLARLRDRNPDARMVYLDWSAPADLRNAERLDPHIDLYVKKHVLRDRSQYGKPTLGDTNLSDFYSQRMATREHEYCFAIPPGFMDKLIIGPSFATAPLLLPEFMKPIDYDAERFIDIHARFAVNGTPWYQAMRTEAETAISDLRGVTVAAGGILPLYQFSVELRRSKVCFSPFGYGEVCWRDYEAIAAGAALIKPDMSHIETAPDIFRPWDTYAPVRWDLADFDETLDRLLGDAALRKSLALNAHTALQEYLRSSSFVDQMRPLFVGSPS